MLLALDHVPGNPDRHLRHVATVIRSTTRSDRLLFRPFNLSSLRFSLNSILASSERKEDTCNETRSFIHSRCRGNKTGSGRWIIRGNDLQWKRNGRFFVERKWKYFYLEEFIVNLRRYNRRCAYMKIVRKKLKILWRKFSEKREESIQLKSLFVLSRYLNRLPRYEDFKVSVALKMARRL